MPKKDGRHWLDCFHVPKQTQFDPHLLNFSRSVRAVALSRRAFHLRVPSAAAMANRSIAENAEEATNTQERQHAPGAEYAQNASRAANAQNTADTPDA